MFGGGSGNGGTRSRDNEKPNPQQYTHHLMIPQLHPGASSISGAGAGAAVSGGGLRGDDSFPMRDERVPQWTNQETRDFIAIRSDLERGLGFSKRSNSKNLWEMVAAKMTERGYRRSAEQCKCKWKNLVDSYKGNDGSDRGNGKQCPFFDELHAHFTAKENKMQRLQLEPEAGSQQARKRTRRLSGDQSSEDLSEDEGYACESDEENVAKGSVATKKKTEKEKRPRTTTAEKSSRQPSLGSSTNNTAKTLENIQEMLRDFFQQQLRIEMEWRETMEKRAREREQFEQEWRSSMEKLERDRMMIEQSWRERGEQRRIREESRAEKRDALLTTLLNKLINENHP